MRQIVFLSGKGGTGKTTFSSSLVAFTSGAIAADCDVDGANMQIALGGRVHREEEFFGMPRVAIDDSMCSRCGLCEELCQFDAIHPPEVKIEACEGCMVCLDHCPFHAIGEISVPCGKWFVSSTEWGPLVHARLDPGEENSGKLVNVVRTEAKRLCSEEGLIILDGPPGIGCPAISALTGCDLAVIVAEPSVSSLHDAERLLELVRQMRVKPVAVINKSDLSAELEGEISRFFEKRGVHICGKLPFCKEVPQIQGSGRPPVAAISGGFSDKLRECCSEILKQVGTAI